MNIIQDKELLQEMVQEMNLPTLKALKNMVENEIKVSELAIKEGFEKEVD